MTAQPDPPESQNQNLRDQAYVGYTRSLLAAEIKPGQFITQRELVRITGFPLGSIRELVPRLEAEGLIRTVPQRGDSLVAGVAGEQARRRLLEE